MSWSKIMFEGGRESREAAWFRTVVEHLVLTADEGEADDLALYVEGGMPVFYVSPALRGRVAATAPIFKLEPCDRPDSGAVELIVGPIQAWDTEWPELAAWERQRRITQMRIEAFDENVALGFSSEADYDFYFPAEDRDHVEPR